MTKETLLWVIKITRCNNKMSNYILLALKINEVVGLIQAPTDCTERRGDKCFEDSVSIPILNVASIQSAHKDD